MPRKDKGGKLPGEAPEGESIDSEIGEKVRFLLNTFKKPNGEPYNYREVEEGTKGEINYSWLWKLANGHVNNPGIQALKSLTTFFGITPDFWFKDLNEWVAEQTSVSDNEQVGKGDELERLALYAKGLNAEDLDIVINLVEAFRKRNEK